MGKNIIPIVKICFTVEVVEFCPRIGMEFLATAESNMEDSDETGFESMDLTQF